MALAYPELLFSEAIKCKYTGREKKKFRLTIRCRKRPLSIAKVNEGKPSIDDKLVVEVDMTVAVES